MPKKMTPVDAKPAKRGRPRKAITGSSQSGSASGKYSYDVPALDKGLDVLEFLAKNGAGATSSEIASHFNRSLQEVYRVILALERRKFIQQYPGDTKFYLSFRMHYLANFYPPLRRLLDLSTPILEKFSAKIGQALHLAVLDHLDIRIIAQCDSPAPLGFRLRVGTTNPAKDTASGGVLLAFQNQIRQESILDEMEFSNPRVERAALLKQLNQIKSDGYVVTDDAILHGITDVSYPILGEDGCALAALTMPYFEITQVHVPFDVATRLQYEAASDISRLLGGELPEPQFPLENRQ